MNTRALILILSIVPLRAFAYDASPMAPPIADTSTGPVVNIDNWMPKPDPKPAPIAVPMPEVAPDVVGKTPAAVAPPPMKPPVVPAATPPVVVPPPQAVVPPAPARAVVAPPPPHIAMNEMTGTISSVDEDAKNIRVSVEGGITPQIDYTDDTVVIGEGARLKISDLQHNDKVVVRYIGKDLIAREIERLKKAPR